MKQNWTYKKLGEVCTIERGGSPRPITEYITDSEDGLNWIKIGDAEEGSKFISSTKEKIKPEGLKKTRFVHKGDFILSNSMSFGKPYILNIDGCIHDGWLVIHDNDNVFDKSFLYYLLGNPNMYKEFQRLAVGGVVNNLNSQLVRNVEVPVPPLAEQQRIVSELDLLQGIMDKQQAQLKELDTLAQSNFYDMFGDPVENEKGWEVKVLEDIATKIGSGATPKGGDSSYIAEGISLIRSLNIYNGQFRYKDLAHINDEQARLLDGVTIRKNDILLNITGASVARCCIVPEDILPARVNQHVAIIRVTDTTIPIFICFQLISKEFQEKLLSDSKANGATREALTKQYIQNTRVILPPLSLQQEFAEKIEKIERQKTAISQSIAETRKLFDYTMDKYFG